jgi:hypothetical protein
VRTGGVERKRFNQEPSLAETTSVAGPSGIFASRGATGSVNAFS